VIENIILYVERHYTFYGKRCRLLEWQRGVPLGLYVNYIHRDHGKTSLESFGHVPGCIPTRVAMIDRKPDVPTSRWPRSGYYIMLATYYRFTVLGVLAEFFLFVPRKSYEHIRISGKI